MGEIREQTVKIIKKTGVHTKEKFRAVTMARWNKKCPSSDPRAEGMLVKELEIKGKKRMCVLVRHLPDGEYDVEVGESLETLLRETYDNGKLSLHAGQQAGKFRHLRRAQVAHVQPEQEGAEILDERCYFPVTAVDVVLSREYMDSHPMLKAVYRIVDKEAFLDWERNEDPEEQEGKVLI